MVGFTRNIKVKMFGTKTDKLRNGNGVLINSKYMLCPIDLNETDIQDDKCKPKSFFYFSIFQTVSPYIRILTMQIMVIFYKIKKRRKEKRIIKPSKKNQKQEYCNEL